MTRKAVVIVPKEDDYKARIEAQEKEETKDVPDNAVMEMKGDYSKPMLPPRYIREVINREYKNGRLLTILWDMAQRFWVKISAKNWDS